MNQFLQYNQYCHESIQIFLKIATNGDKTTLLDRLFQASTTLLLKIFTDVIVAEMFSKFQIITTSVTT